MRAQVGLGQRNRLLKQTGTWRIKGQNYNNAGAVCFKLPHPSESLAKILLENDLTLLLDWTTTLWWQPSTYLSTVCELKVVFTWLEKVFHDMRSVWNSHFCVHKVLLEHSPTNPLTYYQCNGCFCTTTAQLRSCYRDHTTTKPNISFIWLFMEKVCQPFIL